MRLGDYAIRIEPLPDEGGGFLVAVPDLPGCMADGETIEQDIAETQDAFEAWAMAERQNKATYPRPRHTAASSYSASQRASTGARQHAPLPRVRA